MSDITLRQIRYFAALRTTLQYQRAARQLGISQPSLSLQINALESAIGGRLVERRRNGLILTPLGRETATQADKVLREVETLKHIAVPGQSELSGTLRLGSSPTIGPYLLPKVLRKLHISYPDLKLLIRDGPPRELAEDLIAGRHDMILTQTPVLGDDFRVFDLLREPLFLAVACEHPLANHDRVVFADLSGESLLNLSPAYALHHQIAKLSQSSGAILRDEFEGTSLDALRQMVSLGMGVTLLPSLYVQSEVKRTQPDVMVMLTQPRLYRHIGLVWRSTSGHPFAFRTFGEFIRRVVVEEFASFVTPLS